MAIIHEGSDGLYIEKDDGTREYSSMNNFKINGKEIYKFNPETGVLQISMNSSSLDVFLEGIGEIPEQGKDLVLPTPIMGISGPARFYGVKKIESIPGLKESEYMVKIEVVEDKQVIQKKGIFERLKEYLKN